MIECIKSDEEKKRAIIKCDNAFENGILKRVNANDIIYKICNYAEFIIDYENGEIAGYAAMYNNDLDAKIAYITMIGVREEYQQKRIGSELLSKCKKMAMEKGMHKIRLEVSENNKRAKMFYEKSGFEVSRKCSNNSLYMECLLKKL